MRPRAYVVHHVHGRVRFRVPAERANHPFFAELVRRMRQLPSVKAVTADPVTGSVLVTHDGHLPDLVSAALGSDLGEFVDVVMGLPPVARRLRAEITTIDHGIREASDGELDLGTLVSLGLFALAAVQLVRGPHRAGAVSLGWYATELLRRSAAEAPHPP